MNSVTVKISRYTPDCKDWLGKIPIDRIKKALSLEFVTTVKVKEVTHGDNVRSMEEFQKVYFPNRVGKKCPYCNKDLSQKATEVPDQLSAGEIKDIIKARLEHYCLSEQILDILSEELFAKLKGNEQGEEAKQDDTKK